MKIFEESNIGSCSLANRIIRSATYEGGCTADGFPTDDYFNLYSELSRGKPGLIITGFVHVSENGKAMQNRQGGIDTDDKAKHYKKITEEVHCNGSKIFLQLAHTGRQTIRERVNDIAGASSKASLYFKEKPRILNTEEACQIAEQFGIAAKRAKEAGFDGVQIHAAHGYLIHQFLLPAINNRKDIFGIDKNINLGIEFLKKVIEQIRLECSDNFPVIIKISGSADGKLTYTDEQFINLIKFLDKQKIDAIEISYGTMDYALNIMRGDVPLDFILKVNPFYKGHGKLYNTLWKKFAAPVIKMSLKNYTPMYNLKYAITAKKYTKIPIISVGGYRNSEDLNHAINNGINYISMCRPFICEPDITEKFKNNLYYQSKCINCNFCTIACDSNKTTQCYKFKK